MRQVILIDNNKLNIYAKEIQITPQIKINIPTIGEIFDFGEDVYFNTIMMLTSTPYQMMVQLDDAGIDFSKISEFELFELIFPTISQQVLELIMPGIDPIGFVKGVNNQNNEPVIYSPDQGVVIDRFVYSKISNLLRTIHGLKKENKTPGNKAAKDYMIERARTKQKRLFNDQLKNNSGSFLGKQIVALVNCRDFKYNFESIRDMSIYTFTQSKEQIEKYLNYNYIMQGIYSGNVETEKLKLDNIYWLS